MNTTTEYGSVDIAVELPEGAEMPDRPFYTVADLAEIGARVQGVGSMRKETISQHLFESRAEIRRKSGKVEAGKYVSDPFPAPDDYVGKAPWWAKPRESEIVAWFKRHPRRQVGDGIGGRRAKDS
ncbi:hypothetical protein OG559_08560 [Micromonospora sp. NBC_01405]|uniref:hypothetical protein n=1 Tax=Micromonospora sp. NBC_01405 TaxID=2903589 RepID=UPI0032442647